SLLEQQRLRGDNYVVRSQAVMKRAGVRANNLSHGSSEGDHIGANLGFNLRNAVETKISPLANRSGGVLWHDASFTQGFGGRHFDHQPRPEAIFFAPDAAHLGTSVAWDQGLAPSFMRNSGLGIVNGREVGDQSVA